MPTRNWTPDQKNAIEARSGSLLVSAAAGSGKTSVLVERIVRRMLDETDPCPPDALLVVTFTAAAAGEMRQRILSRLKKLSREPEMRDAVRRLIPRLGEMTVSTMDSFCMDLVRHEHAAAGLDPDFGIMDDGEEKALKHAVAMAVIEDAYVSGDPGFLTLARLFTKGRDDAELVGGILYLSDFSMSEPDPAAWLRRVADEYVSRPAGESVWGKELLGRIADGADYCLCLSEGAKADIAGEDKLEEKFGGLFILISDRAKDLRAAAKAGNWDETLSRLDALNAAARARFDAPKGYKDHPQKVAAGEKKSRIKSVLEGLLDLARATEAEYAEDIAALSPAANALIAAVLAFNDRLLEEKKRLGRFSFADIEHFTADLLCDAAAPDQKTDLARELSAGYREILIDEYQDTNRLQDAIFSALSKNGENLFTVGDVKQSIYRFRLASPEIFLERAEAYPLYSEHPDEKRAKILLDANFRSRRGVTNAVNRVFRSIMSKTVGEMDYTEEQWLRPAADYPERDAPDVSFFMVDREKAVSAAEAEAAFTAAYIEQKVREGFPVGRPGEERPAAYGDFCILLRSAKTTAPAFAEALRSRGIPVTLDSKDGFFETAEIRMAVSLLRAVDNPLRDLDLLAYMLSPVGGFTPEEAAVIRAGAADEQNRKKRVPLWSALTLAAGRGDAKAAAFTATLMHYRHAAAAATAAEVVGRVYDETTLLPAAAAMSEGYLRVGNLRVLYETAQAFSADGQRPLSSFVRYLETMQENDAKIPKSGAGAAQNSVKIMTTHRSKGLEFPFVILAGLTKRFNLSEKSSTLRISHNYGVGFKRREPELLKCYETLTSVALRSEARRAGLSEELRIWYVAMTRASENLVFVVSPEKWRDKCAAVENLLSGLSVLPPYYTLSASSPLDWFLSALLRHPDFAKFRQTDLPGEAADFGVHTEIVPVPAPPEREESTDAAPDEAAVLALSERMQKTYRYLPLADEPALHAASHIRDEKFSAEYFGKRVPAFLLEGGMSPADVGTATHKFLQYVSFDPVPEDVEAAAKALALAGRLTPEEAACVDKASIKAFFGSSLFTRIAAADKIHKEFSFTLMKSVRDFDPTLPEDCADEKTVVIGKIDLVLVEGETAVIVDYKTDKVKNAADLIPRYAGQLELYAEAVSRVLGLRVSEKILYSLTKRDFVSWK